MDKKRFSQIAPVYSTSDPRHQNNARVLAQENATLKARVLALESVKAVDAVPSQGVAATAPLQVERNGSLGLKLANSGAQTGSPLAVDATSAALTFVPAAAVTNTSGTLLDVSTQFNLLLASLRAANLLVT